MLLISFSVGTSPCFLFPLYLCLAPVRPPPCAPPVPLLRAVERRGHVHGGEAPLAPLKPPLGGVEGRVAAADSAVVSAAVVTPVKGAVGIWFMLGGGVAIALESATACGRGCCCCCCSSIACLVAVATAVVIQKVRPLVPPEPEPVWSHAFGPIVLPCVVLHPPLGGDGEAGAVGGRGRVRIVRRSDGHFGLQFLLKPFMLLFSHIKRVFGRKKDAFTTLISALFFSSFFAASFSELCELSWLLESSSVLRRPLLGLSSREYCPPLYGLLLPPNCVHIYPSKKEKENLLSARTFLFFFPINCFLCTRLDALDVLTSR